MRIIKAWAAIIVGFLLLGGTAVSFTDPTLGLGSDTESVADRLSLFGVVLGYCLSLLTRRTSNFYITLTLGLIVGILGSFLVMPIGGKAGLMGVVIGTSIASSLQYAAIPSLFHYGFRSAPTSSSSLDQLNQ